jgi:hypothetical protein
MMNSSQDLTLSKIEIYILIALMSKPIEAEYGLVIEQLKEMITSIENIDLLNFNDFSLNLNLTKLKNKQLINSSFNFSIHFYDLTENGSNWLIENESILTELLSL